MNRPPTRTNFNTNNPRDLQITASITTLPSLMNPDHNELYLRHPSWGVNYHKTTGTVAETKTPCRSQQSGKS